MVNYCCAIDTRSNSDRNIQSKSDSLKKNIEQNRFTMSICMLYVVISMVLLVKTSAYAPNKNDYYIQNYQHWKTADYASLHQQRPPNILTFRDFVHRRGYPINRVAEEYDPRPPDVLVSDESKENLHSGGTRASLGEYTSHPITQEESTVPKTADASAESNRFGNEMNYEQNITTVEDSFRKHIVSDLVTGFTYFKGIFTDAFTQADIIADKYLEFEEARMAMEGKMQWPNNVESKEIEDGERARSSTDLPEDYDMDDPACQQELSRCRGLNRSSLEARTDDYDDDDTFLEEARGRRKKKKEKKKQFLRKLLVPLLLSYKLKFFALIPVLISGLVLLVGSTGLAGFFFALFAAVISIKHAHSG